jgi:hypothetical protein
MATDIFGNEIKDKKFKKITIYADEIQQVYDISTNEKWIYTAAIYEFESKPILRDLIEWRYLCNKKNWKDYQKQNDALVHWSELKNDHNKKHIVKRWFRYLLEDCCPSARKFYFSLLGINLSNLNIKEFGRKSQFNNIYNRFFRSMIQYSLKKFGGEKVIVSDILHERGPQLRHDYFDWHTISELDKDERLSFNCKKVIFLPKSHRKDKRSNILQLCDVLLGVFKDLHLGVDKSTYPNNKKELLNSKFVKELLVERVIKNPKNFNSSCGYANRFHISLFPKRKSNPNSFRRLMNNYYDLKEINLAYYTQNQLNLFTN